MAFLGAIVILAGVWYAVADLWKRLPKAQAAILSKWFWTWVIKGLAVPWLIWLVFNSGFSVHFPPIMVPIQMATPGLATWLAFLAAAEIGLFFVASFWAAATLAWLLSLLWQRAEKKREFAQAAFESSLIPGIVSILVLLAFGLSAAGVAGVVWLLPVYQGTIPLAFPEKTSPLYARAITKMHGDKYKEAELAVIDELEKSEEDFKGWMMLAELYANHFDDLAGAERIIRDTCAMPFATAPEVCQAFQSLADWHLKLALDPVAARVCLDEICGRYPGTHMSKMARLRMDRLPRTKDELLDSLRRKPIKLPSLGSNLDLPPEPNESATARKEAAALANECVRKLRLNPDDAAAREELARIFAERLDKVAAAIEQIELLLDMPGASDDNAARWMGLIASWQIKYLGDLQTGRSTLERLVSRFPQSSEALAARRRLTLMDMERKIRTARSGSQSPPDTISIAPFSFDSHARPETPAQDQSG